MPLRRPHTWQLLSVLCRSRKAAQLALQSPELQQLLSRPFVVDICWAPRLNFQSEAGLGEVAKHDVRPALMRAMPSTRWRDLNLEILSILFSLLGSIVG